MSASVSVSWREVAFLLQPLVGSWAWALGTRLTDVPGTTGFRGINGKGRKRKGTAVILEGNSEGRGKNKKSWRITKGSVAHVQQEAVCY